MSDAPVTGFLEESPGVRSATRLAALAQVGAIVGLALVAGVVAIRGGEHAAGIIAAISAMATGLAAGVWAALKERA